MATTGSGLRTQPRPMSGRDDYGLAGTSSPARIGRRRTPAPVPEGLRASTLRRPLLQPARLRCFTLRAVGPAKERLDVDWSPDATVLALTRGDSSEDGSARICTRFVSAHVRRVDLLQPTGVKDIPRGRRTERESRSNANVETATEIVVSNANGGDAKVVGQGSFPAWSPDAHELAFLATRPRQFPPLHEIEVIDPVGGAALRTLDPDHPYDEVENGLTWSPDGWRLAFGFHDPQETFPLTHLATIDADGSNGDRLTSITTLPDERARLAAALHAVRDERRRRPDGHSGRRRHLRSARGRPAPRSRRARRPARRRRRRHPRRGRR